MQVKIIKHESKIWVLLDECEVMAENDNDDKGQKKVKDDVSSLDDNKWEEVA